MRKLLICKISKQNPIFKIYLPGTGDYIRYYPEIKILEDEDLNNILENGIEVINYK